MIVVRDMEVLLPTRRTKKHARNTIWVRWYRCWQLLEPTAFRRHETGGEFEYHLHTFDVDNDIGLRRSTLDSNFAMDVMKREILLLLHHIQECTGEMDFQCLSAAYLTGDPANRQLHYSLIDRCDCVKGIHFMRSKCTERRFLYGANCRPFVHVKKRAFVDTMDASGIDAIGLLLTFLGSWI